MFLNYVYIFPEYRDFVFLRFVNQGSEMLRFIFLRTWNKHPTAHIYQHFVQYIE